MCKCRCKYQCQANQRTSTGCSCRGGKSHLCLGLSASTSPQSSVPTTILATSTSTLSSDALIKSSEADPKVTKPIQTLVTTVIDKITPPLDTTSVKGEPIPSESTSSTITLLNSKSNEIKERASESRPETKANKTNEEVLQIISNLQKQLSEAKANLDKLALSLSNPVSSNFSDLKSESFSGNITLRALAIIDKLTSINSNTHKNQIVNEKGTWQSHMNSICGGNVYCYRIPITIRSDEFKQIKDDWCLLKVGIATQGQLHSRWSATTKLPRQTRPQIPTYRSADQNIREKGKTSTDVAFAVTVDTSLEEAVRKSLGFTLGYSFISPERKSKETIVNYWKRVLSLGNVSVGPTEWIIASQQTFTVLQQLFRAGDFDCISGSFFLKILSQTVKPPERTYQKYLLDFGNECVITIYL
jgi:hypothetical protein